ncbi:MAG: 2,3-bisphosphoglycerate-independent phosphoglycerate mutase [Clostridia bacterium]
MFGLIIMDGFGINTANSDNAITMAGTPNFDKYVAKYPHTTLGASGLDVGLPDGQMGNSEVGHLNMGAGRVVYQDLTAISKQIADGDFFKNAELLGAMKNATENRKKLHVMGLLGPGGVHSHIEHLQALIQMAKDNGVPEIYVHCFLDGRDVPPTSASGYIKELYAFMQSINYGKIASVCGRFYAMDRDNRWERVVKAYDMLTLGIGNQNECPYDAVEKSYAEGITDEFVLPTSIVKDGKPVATVEKGDSIVFFNYRPDRAREITRAFTVPEFGMFERKTGYLAPHYVCFTRYDDSFQNVEIAFKPRSLDNTLGEYLSKCNKTQLRIAETEKYAHVTFFFNGGVEAANPNEDRELIPSPKVATYDLQPEMSAQKVADRAVELVKSNKYDVMILNFANCDMVGHTGIFEAAEVAVRTVDACVKQVVDAVLVGGGQVLLTADHGNADKMRDENGKPFTAHTTNPVPLVLIGDTNKKLADGGKLCDIAPTLLEMMNLPIPAEMTGKSLLR